MLIYQSPRNPHSHLAIKERKSLSYPTRRLLSMGLVRGRVLDFGCGTGIDVAFLRKQGLEVTGYDPHYAPEPPDGRFDTILCHYVLNCISCNCLKRPLRAINSSHFPDSTIVPFSITNTWSASWIVLNLWVTTRIVRLPFISVIAA